MHFARRPRFVIPAAVVVALVVTTGAAVLLLRDGSDSDEPAQDEVSLVFAEFGNEADRIYTAPASDPEQRSLIATVDHVAEWGMNPATAAAGSLVAYTVLPPDSEPMRDAPAELWLLDVESKEQTRLASDADLLTVPLFDRQGTQLIYRVNGEEGEQSLVRVNLATGERRELYSTETQFGIFPVGFEDDGTLLFASLSQGGTDLYRLADGQQPVLLLHASDQIARDWRLSPDGRSVSFVAPEIRAERVVNRVQVVDLGGGTRSAPGDSVDTTSDQFAPVWRPSSDAVTIGREAYPEASAAAVTLPVAGGTPEPLAAPAQGFDVPLGWSPDGQYLAARSFDGSTAYEPGRESMVVISTDGERRLVTAETDLLFLGWVASG